MMTSVATLAYTAATASASRAVSVETDICSPAWFQLTFDVPGHGMPLRKIARYPAPAVSATIRLTSAAVAPAGTPLLLPFRSTALATLGVSAAFGPMPGGSLGRESYTRTGLGRTWRLPAVVLPPSLRQVPGVPSATHTHSELLASEKYTSP